MSDLGFNKIAFCVLGTGLPLIGLNEASHAFFHTEHHEKDGYDIDIPEARDAGRQTAVVEGPRDYFTLISAADVDAGKEVAEKCTQCHKFEPGAEPLRARRCSASLGRDIASDAGFKYSTGTGSMSEHGRRVGLREARPLTSRVRRRSCPATAMNFSASRSRPGPHQPDRLSAHADRRRADAAAPPLPPHSRRSGGRRALRLKALPRHGRWNAGARRHQARACAGAEPAPATPAPAPH